MEKKPSIPQVKVVPAKLPPKPSVVGELKTGKPVVVAVTGFAGFLRDQGVINLSIAVVLGAAVTKLVAAFVTDIINPVIGVMVGAAGDLASFTLKVGPIEILWGHFLVTAIDFVVVAAVVYFLIKILKLDKFVVKKA